MLEIGQQNLDISMDFESTATYVFSTALNPSGTTLVGWCAPFDTAGC